MVIMAGRGYRAVFPTSWFFLISLLNLMFLFSLANAQIIVQPMVIDQTLAPGQTSKTTLRLKNPGQERTQARVETVDLAKDREGQWVLLEGVNRDTTDLVIVPSCRHWLVLDKSDTDAIDIGPDETMPLDLQIQVPAVACGSYQAAVKITLGATTSGGIHVRYAFVVPVMLNVGDSETSPGTGVPPVAHFTVYPMKYSLKSRPGKSIEMQLYLQNPRPHMDDSVSLDVIDVHCPKYSQWFVDDSNVLNPNYRDLLDRESCCHWISLGKHQEKSIEVGSVSFRPVGLKIDIPSQAKGFFSSAILVCFQAGRNRKGIAVKYEFIVPVCLEIDETVAIRSTTPPQEFRVTVKQQRSFKVTQDMSSGDPVHTYSGENLIEVCTNFPAGLQTSVKATGPAGGNWLTAVTPKDIGEKTMATVSLKGSDVRIEKLFGPDPLEKVAELTVRLIPHCRNRPACRLKNLTPDISCAPSQ